MPDKPVAPLTAPAVVDSRLLYGATDTYTLAYPTSLVCNDALGRLCIFNKTKLKGRPVVGWMLV